MLRVEPRQLPSGSGTPTGLSPRRSLADQPRTIASTFGVDEAKEVGEEDFIGRRDLRQEGRGGACPASDAHRQAMIWWGWPSTGPSTSTPSPAPWAARRTLRGVIPSKGVAGFGVQGHCRSRTSAEGARRPWCIRGIGSQPTGNLTYRSD